jgi:hypothetical protein
MPMRMRFTVLLVLTAMVVGLALPFTVAAAKPTSGGTLTAPVTGTLADGTGRVVGTFTPTKAIGTTHTTSLVGTFDGTIYDASGNVLAQGTQTITLPIADPSGSCQILNLTLGPLDLNLLGLMVHLDTVHLTITAQPGNGNLLGNLLCAVAGLLDQNTLGTALTNLLNQILAILNGL